MSAELKCSALSEIGKDITLLTFSKAKDLYNTEMTELVLQFKTAGFAEKFFAALTDVQYDEVRVYPFNNQVCFYVKNHQRLDRLFKTIQTLAPSDTYVRRCNLVLRLFHINLTKPAN